MGKVRRAISMSVKALLLSAIVLEGGTQVGYCANDISNKIFPSPERKKFRQEFGIELKGWRSEIEDDKVIITKIADIVNQERARFDFDLKSIEVRSESKIKMHFIDQVQWLAGYGSSSYCNFITDDSITLAWTPEPDTIRHEIKHAITADIDSNHPEFIEKWEALALDRKGESMYYGWIREILGMQPKISLRGNEQDGFVSSYARVARIEDIAELSRLAEDAPLSFIGWLGEGEKRNEKIAAKVRLAQEYHIIPPEFSEYVRMISPIYPEPYAAAIFTTDEKSIADFMEESKIFIERHPDTAYFSEIKNRRGYFLERSNRVEEAIGEYEASLEARVKPISDYIAALWGLVGIYSRTGDEGMEEVYSSAKKEYQTLVEKGDVSVVKNGVNDFIADKKRKYKK